MRMYVWDTATPYRDGDLEGMFTADPNLDLESHLLT